MFLKRYLHGFLGLAIASFIFGGPYSLAQDAGGDDPVTIFNRAQDLHEKGDIQGAVKLYQAAIALNADFAEAQYQLGVAELSLKHEVEAERAFRRAGEIRPDWSLALAKLGQMLVAKYISDGAKDQPLHDEALVVLKKTIALDENSFPAVTALVDLRLFEAHPDPAVLKELLVRVTALTTGKSNLPSSIWTARAALEERLGDRRAASASLSKVLSDDKNNSRALYQLSSLAIAEGDLISAKDLITRYEANAGEPDAVRFLKAGVMAKEGDLSGAVAQLNAIQRPTAAAKELSERITTAKSDDVFSLEKKLESEPKNASVLGRLCSLTRRSNPEKAIDYCRRAVEAEPANLDWAVGYGAALVQAKQYDAAIAFFRKLTSLAPENATAHANLATALFQLKRYEEAKIEYNWLIDKNAGVTAAYYFIGIVYDQLGEYMDAMANYQLYLRKADPVKDKDQIDNVNFRLPILQKLIREGKGKKT